MFLSLSFTKQCKTEKNVAYFTMSDDNNKHNTSSSRDSNRQQLPWPLPWGMSPVTTAAASALLSSMDSTTTTAAAAAAAVLASAEAQSILEDVCGTSSIISNTTVHASLSSSVDSGGSSRRNSNVATAAGIPPSSGQQEAALLPEQQQKLEAAIHLLPEADKEAYQEALLKSPHLIALESPLRRYWQLESDPREAARRLCAYWHQRKLCFGSRACLPMVQTGKGTMSPEDVELLASGFCMLLPPDRHGRVVLLHDRSRLTNLDAERRIRCIFYLLHVASEQPPLPSASSSSSSPPGLVWITVYSDKTRASAFDVHTVTRTLQICASGAFSLQFKAFHLIMLTNRPILDSVVPTTLELLQKHFPHLRQRTMVHPKLPLPELLKELEAKYGLDPEHLPKVPLGGRWTIGSFKRWRDDRLYDEQKWLEKIKIKQQTPNSASMMTEMGSTASIQAEEESREQEMIPPHHPADNLPQCENFYFSEDYDDEEKASSAAVAELEEDERRKRRAVDAMYARRRRVRRKIEMEGMQEQVHNLRQQQMGLLRTHQFLIGLFHRAEECVRQEAQNQVPSASETDAVKDLATSLESEVRDGIQSSIDNDTNRKVGKDTVLNLGDEYSAKDNRERANVNSPSIASSNHPETDSGAARSAMSVPGGTEPESRRFIDAANRTALSNTRLEHLVTFEPPRHQANTACSQQSARDIPDTKPVENEPTKPARAVSKVRTGIGDEQPEIMQQSTSATIPVQGQSREERQQALVQSWHEKYAQYQMLVNTYVQQRREEQQAAVAAAVATAALQEAYQRQAQYQTSSMMGSVVNDHLLQQAWLVWIRQQQLREGSQQEAQQQENPQSQQRDAREQDQSSGGKKGMI